MAENTPKIAVVTGAGSGIGRAVALALNAKGWRVVLVGRRSEAIAATVALASEPAAMLAHSADISQEPSVAALFERVENQYGRLDLLFNNAGIGAPGVPAGELTFAQWKAVIDVNLNGAFLCAKYAIALMQRQDPRGGRIVNNGSIAAYMPRRNSAAYTTSKHAITGLTKAISLDYRDDEIACGQIDIGNAQTDMTAPMQAGVLQADGSVAAEPVMDVAHVGEAVLYMAGLPLDANVQFMTVMARKMPYIGRG